MKLNFVQSEVFVLLIKHADWLTWKLPGWKEINEAVYSRRRRYFHTLYIFW